MTDDATRTATDDATRSERSNPSEQSTPSELPVVDFDDEPVDSAIRRPTVAGIVLAAGTSSRFGRENKLLATVDGEPIVRHAVRTLVESPVGPVVVVLGHEADRVRQALDGLGVETVVNEAYETGQASSVRTGVAALRERDDGAAASETPADCEAAIVALGDMPSVEPTTVETILNAYARGVADAIAPAYEGVRGNPVVFDRQFFAALADVDGDVGGREILLTSETSALVAVDDPGVRRDIDRPDDL